MGISVYCEEYTGNCLMKSHFSLKLNLRGRKEKGGKKPF
jgi:hypothetical protein